MNKFIAFIWDHCDIQKSYLADTIGLQLQADEAWELAYSADGLRVLTRARSSAFHVYPLHNAGGVVVGRLFKRHSPDEPDSSTVVLGPVASARIRYDGGNELIRNYWGRYVAFIRGEFREYSVIREPSGALPCYQTEIQGLTVFFTHLNDLSGLGHNLGEINWSYIENYLHFPRTVTQETGLTAVTQVRAGERIRFDAGRFKSASFLWNPVPIAESSLSEDPSEALSLLHRAVTASVQSWAGCFDSIIHELSGGLDSSVIAASLKTLPTRPKIVCFNMYAKEAEGDERRYARQVANHMGFDLVEAAFEPVSRSLASMLGQSPAVSPLMMKLASTAESIRARLAASANVQAIFSGRGGDHLFHQRSSRLGAAEYVYKHGLNTGLLHLMKQTARLSEASMLAIIYETIKGGVFRISADPYRKLESSSIFNLNLGAGQSYRHPWVEEAKKLPGNKRQQIFDLVDSQIFWIQQSDYADIVHPLISQPIIECCLRIATYQLTFEGRERGLLRAAFTPYLPNEIIQRTQKGMVLGSFLDLILTNQKFIQEFLFDGMLMQRRLLNRTALSCEFSEGRLLKGASVKPLLAAILAEAWARNLQTKEAG